MKLPYFRGVTDRRCARDWFLEQGSSKKLERLLADVVGRPLRGCRLDVYGTTLPFSGTQVCGYTLEHALGIVPNSAMDGDIYGIELKTHTQLKVTLFTPEPDMGLYARNFKEFMEQYGYRDADGDYRLTGIHRSRERCAKSGLTLRVREFRVYEIEKNKTDWIRSENGDRRPFPYDFFPRR
ncbi:MvaI/BcnI family restriction endonuclease [Undibacterium arcticum]